MNTIDIIANLSNAKMQFISDRAEEELLIKKWQQNQNKLFKYKQYNESLEKVRVLFQKAAEITQKQLEVHISGLVSTTLAAIWDDPYEFKLEFVPRRGKTEADLWLVKHNEKMDPLSATGGGVVDIVSMALRMAFWSLTKTAIPLLFLDEPFKHLNGDELQKKASNMLNMLSEKLGLQIIIVSGVKQFIKNADRIFNVTQIKDISIVEIEK